MRGYWAQFARTGEPNSGGVPHWPAYDEHSRECFDLGGRIGVRPVPERTQALENILKQVVAMESTTALRGTQK